MRVAGVVSATWGQGIAAASVLERRQRLGACRGHPLRTSARFAPSAVRKTAGTGPRLGPPRSTPLQVVLSRPGHHRAMSEPPRDQVSDRLAVKSAVLRREHVVSQPSPATAALLPRRCVRRPPWLACTSAGLWRNAFAFTSGQRRSPTAAAGWLLLTSSPAAAGGRRTGVGTDHLVAERSRRRTVRGGPEPPPVPGHHQNEARLSW